MLLDKKRKFFLSLFYRSDNQITTDEMEEGGACRAGPCYYVYIGGGGGDEGFSASE